jgi:hypothetical protein
MVWWKVLSDWRGHAEFYSICSTLALALGTTPNRTVRVCGARPWKASHSGVEVRSNRCGFQQRKGHPGAWPDGLSDELPAFAPVPFTIYQSANITKERREPFQEKAPTRREPLASSKPAAVDWMGLLVSEPTALQADSDRAAELIRVSPMITAVDCRSAVRFLRLAKKWRGARRSERPPRDWQLPGSARR